MSFDPDQSLDEIPACFVGTLCQLNPETGRTANPFPIYSNEEIYIGRDGKRCQYVVENPFISNRHLRIYTVIFDQDNPLEVTPLVYAQDTSMNGTLWNGYLMGKGNGSFLLSDGDTLRLSPEVHLQFQCERHKEESYFDMLQRIEMREFADQFVVSQRRLGSGAYGKVHMAFKKETGQQLACKIVDLRAIKDRVAQEVMGQHSKFFQANTDAADSAQLGVVRAIKKRKIQEKLEVYNREARILASLCHPNIISVEKVIKSSNTIYLFQDLVTAGDLFSFIQYKGGRLGDIESAVIVRQVLMALEYLHDRDIVHRDLKPDNILMTSLADGCRVVLTDFGCARLLQSSIGRMSTMVGTFEYSAPEVLKSNERGYTKAVDLWSIGCVTVVLLVGDSPFRDQMTGSYSAELARKCDLAKLETDMDWTNVGKRAKEFVRGLLVLDEVKRMHVKDALRHEWFTNPAHKREFEALYQRSIKDWKPRVFSGDLIVDLSSLIDSKTSAEVENSRSEEISQNDPSDTNDQHDERDFICDYASSNLTLPGIPKDWAPNATKTRFSPTLSDPELPEHNRIQYREEDPGLSRLRSNYGATYASSNTSGLSEEPIPSITEKWINKNKPRKFALQKETQVETNQTRSEPRTIPSQAIAREALWPTEYASFDQRTILEGYCLAGQKRSRSSTLDELDDGDEVYEEVSNSITGKRQHGGNVPEE